MLEHAEIRRILPHDHPMVLVDRIVSLEPGVSAVGTKAITGGEPCYRGLQPGARPEAFAYPASLLLESFGQTAAILWLTSARDATVGDDRVLMLVALKNCRLERDVFPGDVLEHRVEIETIVGDNVFVGGESVVDGKRVATIESMMAVVRPRAVLLEEAHPPALLSSS
jgi:3-hydroxyacyl-[acyl-carrier-protein] dehydratase